MGERKLMSAREAVSRFVADGDVVYAGYTSVAMGLTREVIRQRKRDLDIVGGSVGMPGTQLFMAGCSKRTRTGYIGAALRPGVIQDRMSAGDFEYEDYSNQAIALMLMAGALGIPFIPTRSFLGTDYLNPEFVDHPGGFLGKQKWAEMESPFDGQKVVLLPALRPDVALLHAQRADDEGNVQVWGHLGDARWAYWAAKKVIVSVEEVVPREVVRNDPSRTVVPGFRVSAVVHLPWGAHPTGFAGYYDFDYAFQATVFAGIVRSQERFDAYASEWVDGLADHDAYLAHVRAVFGDDTFDRLKATRGHSPAPGINYTYAPELSFRPLEPRP